MTLEDLIDKLKDKVSLYPYLDIKGFAVLLDSNKIVELKNSCQFYLSHQVVLYGKNYELNIIETHAENQCEIYSNL